MSSEDGVFNRFQPHCLSKEESNNILIPQILAMGKTIHQYFNQSYHDATIAMVYGKRLIVSNDAAPINTLEREDIIEIIDVDPVKQTILFLGPNKPPLMAPLLYMLCSAKKEIQHLAIITLKTEKANKIKQHTISSIKKEKTFLGLLKSILIQLQKQNGVLIDKEQLLLIGETNEHLKTIIEHIGEKE